jgi:hypothetical protein
MEQLTIKCLPRKSETATKPIMNTKKSLGHFPFGSDYLEKSDLSFIPNINGGHESDYSDSSTSPFDVTESDIERSERIAGSDEMLSTELVERDLPSQEEKPVPKKKVASYYLEEALINRLKAFSDAINSSYSAVASDAIDIYITERGH